jgi:hypothetical protein
MERLRPPRPSEGASLDTIHPLPGRTPLPELLAAVSSPGVLQDEIDELLRGLARPLTENESPRARADFLLSVLESREAMGLKGSDGRSVGLATVEALLELGYPYALEVPPEALEAARRARGDALPRDRPRTGIAAALVALIAQSIVSLPAALDFLDGGTRGRLVFGLFILGASWGPSLSALLGGWLRSRGLQRLGVITMALMGSLWLSLFGLAASTNLHDLPKALTVLIAGLSLVVGSILLRNPEWLAQEDAPPSAPPPPAAPDSSTPDDPA